MLLLSSTLFKVACTCPCELRSTTDVHRAAAPGSFGWHRAEQRLRAPRCLLCTCIIRVCSRVQHQQGRGHPYLLGLIAWLTPPIRSEQPSEHDPSPHPPEMVRRRKSTHLPLHPSGALTRPTGRQAHSRPIFPCTACIRAPSFISSPGGGQGGVRSGQGRRRSEAGGFAHADPAREGGLPGPRGARTPLPSCSLARTRLCV